MTKTQPDDEESLEAKENIRNRGRREKERYNKKAREENLVIGMKVLLKGQEQEKRKSKI